MDDRGRGEDVYPNNITPASHILLIKNLYTEYKHCNDVFVYPNVLQSDIVIEHFFCAIFLQSFCEVSVENFMKMLTIF